MFSIWTTSDKWTWRLWGMRNSGGFLPLISWVLGQASRRMMKYSNPGLSPDQLSHLDIFSFKQVKQAINQVSMRALRWDSGYKRPNYIVTARSETAQILASDTAGSWCSENYNSSIGHKQLCSRIPVRGSDKIGDTYMVTQIYGNSGAPKRTKFNNNDRDVWPYSPVRR